MGFVCFLWTVVTHGLEVSFKDKCWEPDSSSLAKKKNTVNTPKWGMKCWRRKKKNPSRVVDDFKIGPSLPIPCEF